MNKATAPASGDRSCEDKRIKTSPCEHTNFFSNKKLVPKLLVPRMTALYTTEVDEV